MSTPKSEDESHETPSDGSDGGDENEPLKLQKPLRRYAPLLMGIAVVLVVGPAITRTIANYRAIVLEVREGKTLLAFDLKPPRWVEGSQGKGGEIVLKEAGSWDPQIVPHTPQDHDMRTMYKRWARSYSGTIVRIIDPTRLKGPYTAVVELEGTGKRLHLSLDAPGLDGAAVGRRVSKRANTWVPALVDNYDPVLQETQSEHAGP